MRIDVHQHLWGPELLAALARRTAAPRARRAGREWELELPAEATSSVRQDSLTARAQLLGEDGLDAAWVALSPALGVDGLPGEEAAELLAAHRAGVAAPFARWAALPLREAAADDVDAVLDGGALGLCIPTGALLTPDGWGRLGPLLERLAARGAPLFVHPGPDPWARLSRPAESTPAWWPALTDYLTGLHTAWMAWVAGPCEDLPALRVVWAALAGLAPLHRERLGARGGIDSRAVDPRAFYDTSSYGPRAVAAMVGVVGIDQLVFGSDRPVVEPAPAGGWAPLLGEEAWAAMTHTNPVRALRGDPHS